jgi:GTP-binding protein YchF
MEIGIVGLQYSGKSTIFSTLLQHESSDSSGGKESAERGIVKVPDDRLDKLTELVNPKKQTNATLEFIKVPGLDQETNQGQGLPSQFLNNLKNVEALLVLIRHFENEYHPHPMGRIDSSADIELINSEFLLSDLMLVEQRIERLQKMIPKTKNEQDKRVLDLMIKLKDQLNQEKPLRDMDFSEDELFMLKAYQFLTIKPLLYVINIQEDQIENTEQIAKELSGFVTKNCALTILSAEIEKEIAELEQEDADVFIEDLGIKEPAMYKLIRKSYELLGLISFFTVGEKECRAWTIRNGSTAQKAAGAIHSDLEKGFIRSETVHYDDFVVNGSLAKCKEKGLLRLEGKEYIVKDGDIMTIRFNV